MDELFPVVSGLLIGSLLGLTRPTTRIWIGVILAVVFGALATLFSGEFEVSWAFLLVDIPLVAISSAVGLLAARRARLGRWTILR